MPTRGRSRLGGTKISRPGVNKTRVSNFGRMTATRTVQSYSHAPRAPQGFRRPRKVVTGSRTNRRSGRNVTYVRTVTGPRGISVHRRAVFITRSGPGPSQATAIAGAYKGTTLSIRKARSLSRTVKSSGYRKSYLRSSPGVPVYVQRRRRNRVRRDSRGRYAGSYAG